MANPRDPKRVSPAQRLADLGHILAVRKNRRLRKVNAGMIAMPTTGQHGVVDAFRRSVTQRVLHGSPCPMLATCKDKIWCPLCEQNHKPDLTRQAW